MPPVGEKDAGSSPGLLLQDLRLRGEPRGKAVQLEAFFSRWRCLGEQGATRGCSPQELAVCGDEPGGGFLLADRGQLLQTGRKWARRKFRARLGSEGQIPTGHAAVCLLYSSRGSHQCKCAVAQKFKAISVVLYSPELPRCFTKPLISCRQGKLRQAKVEVEAVCAGSHHRTASSSIWLAVGALPRGFVQTEKHLGFICFP